MLIGCVRVSKSDGSQTLEEIVKAGIARLPEDVSWQQMRAVSVIGGIGFTMSLFIGMLAFPEPQYAAPLRIGVLAGSILSGFVGYALLWRATAGVQDKS